MRWIAGRLWTGGNFVKQMPASAAPGRANSSSKNRYALLCIIFRLGRGGHAFQPAQQIFLGHPVELRFGAGIERGQPVVTTHFLSARARDGP